MIIFDKLWNFFKHRAVIVNENKTVLKKEVSIAQKVFGSWWNVKGCSGYRDLFFTVEIDRIEKHPCEVVFMNEATEEEGGNRILEKITPRTKMVKYSDTQDLTKHLPGFI